MEKKRWSNITRSGKLHYNPEQLAHAKQASALEYARSRGYELVKSGSRWTMQGHDSMIFLPDGRWYWNSQGRFGRAIEFCMYYENCTLPEAVLLLNGVDPASPISAPAAGVPQYAAPQTETPQEKKELEMPVRSQNMRRSFSYLAVTRGIDYQLIRALVQDGRIFETESRQPSGAVYHNVAFAGLDADGVIRSISLRGCAEKSTFKAEVPGSDKTIPFIIPGRTGAKVLYVFESAIDAMSDATLQKLMGGSWDSCTRLAMGGNNTIEPILRQLKAAPGLETVVFALDNDDGGRKQAEMYRSALLDAGLDPAHIESISVPYGKDWNEYLKCWRTVISRSANLPTTEAVGPDMECCGRIHLLREDGSVDTSVAYADPKQFHMAVRQLYARKAPFVAETPEQLRELQRSEQRRQTRQQQR